MLPDCACSCVRAARIASFYWRDKEKERVGGYDEEEEEEEEEEEQRQNEDAVGMVLPNRKEARDSKKRKPTRGQEMETPGEAIE